MRKVIANIKNGHEAYINKIFTLTTRPKSNFISQKKREKIGIYKNKH